MYSINSSKFLSDSEQDLLMKSLKNLHSKYPKWTLLIELAIKTGARASELLNIAPSDVNYEDKMVLIHGIKGSMDRELPLSHDLFQKLADFIQKNPGNKVFNISYQRLYQVWNEFKPCNKSFHSLRHTFAINLYKKTRDIRLVQVALGHKQIANTMVYANYIFSKEELRRAIL